ncbi:armadillo-type protein, partial [Mycena capillaripes]
LYARLCRILMDNINRSMRSAEGKPVVGARLFRKILCDGLQGEFERGRNNMQGKPVSVVALVYQTKMLAHNVEKRKFLGLVRFMAELFRVPMLTERIMYESIKVLLGNVEYALVNGIEAICLLLDTAGSLLDNPGAHAHMEAYFSRMQEYESDVHTPNRIRFLIQ